MERSIIHLYMPNGGEDGCIQLWYVDDDKWVEVRGKPYSLWQPYFEQTPFRELHDGVSGWCRAWLHADQIVNVFNFIEMPHHKKTFILCQQYLRFK